MYASQRPSGENSDCHKLLREALRTFHGFCPERERKDPETVSRNGHREELAVVRPVLDERVAGRRLELLLRLRPVNGLREDVIGGVALRRKHDPSSIGRPDRIHVRRVAARELDSALAGNVVDPQVDVAVHEARLLGDDAGAVWRESWLPIRARVGQRLRLPAASIEQREPRRCLPRLEVVNQHSRGHDVERRISFGRGP